jgi:hypothetical protein
LRGTDRRLRKEVRRNPKLEIEKGMVTCIDREGKGMGIAMGIDVIGIVRLDYSQDRSSSVRRQPLPSPHHHVPSPNLPYASTLCVFIPDTVSGSSTITRRVHVKASEILPELGKRRRDASVRIAGGRLRSEETESGRSDDESLSGLSRQTRTKRSAEVVDQDDTDQSSPLSRPIPPATTARRRERRRTLSFTTLSKASSSSSAYLARWDHQDADENRWRMMIDVRARSEGEMTAGSCVEKMTPT